MDKNYLNMMKFGKELHTRILDLRLKSFSFSRLIESYPETSPEEFVEVFKSQQKVVESFSGVQESLKGANKAVDAIVAQIKKASPAMAATFEIEK